MMRELNYIENNGRFDITFMSDDKEEANTIMNAIQRFISKNSKKEIKENINDNNKSYVKDYSRCPIDGPSKDVYFNLFSDDRLIELYNNDELEQGYKDYIKNELNKRGIFDLSMPKLKKKMSKKEDAENMETSKKTDLENKIKSITNGRAYNELTDEELEKIIPLDKELSVFYNTTETAKHILQGRKFNKSIELENKITQGRRLEQLTIEELKELEKVTMLDHYREDIQKEIDKRKNTSFEETLKENNEIISFGEDKDDSNYRIDDDSEEDPLSLGVDEDNIKRWDFDADGDKVDADGNKMLFDM